eukprot:CAMPEP_0196661566 /NCGR_PEP_ID=MMETSP1086-20130531/44898_1 /TAXON_ID=77921 /ORGANISM="Cyanoptyche  gloeocystis , Strain SAG4.97" /LENGTH=104 /DNA_ID=CAMNT_0041996523 /DNA_START=1304 /DNA_END=1618 /DNA_ORIENTATION=+
MIERVSQAFVPAGSNWSVSSMMARPVITTREDMDIVTVTMPTPERSRAFLAAIVVIAEHSPAKRASASAEKTEKVLYMSPDVTAGPKVSRTSPPKQRVMPPTNQ